MERKEIKKHPCMLPEGILEGFVCPYCLKIYPTKEQAIRCKDSHEEFEIDYIFEKGYRFPTEVLIKRIIGVDVVEIGTYKLEKVEELDENGKVKKTIRKEKV